MRALEAAYARGEAAVVLMVRGARRQVLALALALAPTVTLTLTLTLTLILTLAPTLSFLLRRTAMRPRSRTASSAR